MKRILIITCILLSVFQVRAAVTATNNSPKFVGNTVNLTATGGAGATYFWHGPNGFTSTLQNPTIPTIILRDSGLYTVVETIAGVSDSITTFVHVDSISVLSTRLCVGSGIQFYSFGGVAGTYHWHGPNGFISLAANPSIMPSVLADSGLYTFVETIGGISDSSTIRIIIDSMPYAPLTAWTNDQWTGNPFCVGSSIHFYVSDTAFGFTYLWTGPGFPTGSSLQDPVIPAATLGDGGTYTVLVRNGTCSSTTTLTVTVNARVTPPIPVIPVIFPICSGKTLNLTCTDTAGAEYMWTGPNGFSSTLQSPSIPNIITAYSGLYSVSAYYGGCPAIGNTTVYVTVDSTPKVDSIYSIPLHPCAAVAGGVPNTFTLNVISPTPGTKYTWTGPLAFSSTIYDPTRDSISTAMSGYYSVIVYKTYGAFTCYDSVFTNVTVGQTPLKPTTTTNTPCSGGSGTLILTGTSSPPGGTWYWAAPDGWTSNLQNPTRSPVPIGGGGLYTVTDSIGFCGSPIDSIYVTIDTTPTIPSFITNSPICAGDTLKIYAVDSLDSALHLGFLWTNSHGVTFTTQNIIIPNADTSKSGLYTLVVQPGPCQVSNFVSYVVSPVPTLKVSNNSPVCTGGILNFTSIIDTGVTISWVGPYSFMSTIPDPSRSPVILEYTGIYQITVTARLGCSKTVNDTVVVHATPNPPQIKYLTYCQEFPADSVQVIGSNLLWYSNDIAGTTGSPNPPVPSTANVGLTYYFVTQTVQGCISSLDSVLVTINPRPKIAATPISSTICPYDTVIVQLADTSSTPITYKWYPFYDVKDSLMYAPIGKNAISTKVYPIVTQEYTIVGTNSYGCTDTTYTTVNVLPAAIIDLGDSIILYPGEVAHLQAVSNCSSFNWFPPETLDNRYISSPTASPTTNTKYILTATNEYGCVGVDSVKVHVYTKSIVNLPNAFTPGTGVNYIFKIQDRGIVSLVSFNIYNRWGVLVFSTSDINQGWDGTYKAAPQPMDVYVYVVTAITDDNGRQELFQGNITLLR